MRRLLLLFVLVPTFSWLLWASCQSDDYRSTLPFRVFDAAPREAGALPDLTAQADLGDMGRADQGAADLPAVDGGPRDAQSGSDAGMDGGAVDAGGLDGGAGDGGLGG